LAEKYRADDKEVMESGKRKQVEEPLTDSEGKSFWIETTKTPIYDEQGNFNGTAGIARDITKRKRAEEELRKRENLLQKIFDVLPVGLWFADKEGKLLRGNSAGVKIWGAEPKVGLSEYDVFKARRLPSGEKIAPEDWALAHTVREGVTVVDEMLEIDAFDGKKKVILNYTAPVLDDRGAIQGAIVVNLDITRLKETEEQLQHTLDSLRKAFSTTIQIMVSAIETRDPYTAGHQVRSADLARTIATEMGLSRDQIESIRMACTIHDIGKLSIPAEILSKPTKLSEFEFALIKEHSRQGYEILKDVESPWPLAEIVYQHHERMDGSGYPRNLKGDEILMEARIIAVADVVESMASHRPYRPALGLNAALEEIEKNKGIFYDNAVADACLRLFREKGFQLAGS
jgi:HD-GYP domain-containing protein (c-di-GMP phosphodiesterase class II)